MNKITLIGNLTRDPETRATQSGITVCSFNIAVNRRFAGADGQKQTDYFRINAWRQLGDICGQYLSKGKKVAVVGELQARTYEGKDGHTYMSLDVSADEVEFLTPKDQGGSGYPAQSPSQAPPPASPASGAADLSGFTDIEDDDIPF